VLQTAPFRRSDFPQAEPLWRPGDRCYSRRFPDSGGGQIEGVEQAPELRAGDLWSEVSARLRETLNESTYNMGFAAARAGHLDETSFVLFVPNDFTRDWIEGHVRGLLEGAVRDTLGEEREVQLAVREHHAAGQPTAPPPRAEGLNPKYTFDSFVIGSSHRFSHAAAPPGPEAPPQAANPPLIYRGAR